MAGVKKHTKKTNFTYTKLLFLGGPERKISYQSQNQTQQKKQNANQFFPLQFIIKNLRQFNKQIDSPDGPPTRAQKANKKAL